MTPLHYHAGPPVRLGDRVRWGDEGQGTVVVMIAEQAALPGYVAAEWGYLVRGCMISVDATGLFHNDEEGLEHDANLVLLVRAWIPGLALGWANLLSIRRLPASSGCAVAGPPASLPLCRHRRVGRGGHPAHEAAV